MDQNMEAITETTDTPAQDDSQAQATKTYTQKEFDDAMAKMKSAVLNKALKPYQDLGDVEELRKLKTAAQESQYQEQIKRGEFDNIIKEVVAKKDAEIQKRDTVIREYKIDTPLVNAAAKYRSINPDQVKALLKSNLRLGEEGEVEVVGTNGQVKYTDAGNPYTVDELVREFLDTNPHFVNPTPSTTNTRSSVANERGVLDISKLDMSNPNDRKIYADWKKSNR